MQPQYNTSDFGGRTVTQTVTVKNYPWEDWYDDRTYTDDSGNEVRWFPDGEDIQIEVPVDSPDGVPDAIQDGTIEPTWHKQVRTDMKENQNFNIRLSAKH